LFNRVRGQTVSTRYLSIGEESSVTGFGVTGSGWSAFEVVLGLLPLTQCSPLEPSEGSSAAASSAANGTVSAEGEGWKLLLIFIPHCLS
jgi:hypothetical protein